MMLRMLKIVEFVWIGMAFICGYEFINHLSIEGNMKYIFGGGVIVSIFMFFFRRKIRLRYEQIQREKEAEQEA